MISASSMAYSNAAAIVARSSINPLTPKINMGKINPIKKVTRETVTRKAFKNFVEEHDNIFITPNMPREEFAQNLAINEKELLEQVESMIFSTEVGLSLKSEFTFLKNRKQIDIGVANTHAFGLTRFSPDTIYKTRIFLQTNQSVKAMAATLIHELRHFQDMINTSKSESTAITIYETEMNAFADKYVFLKEFDLLESAEFTKLKPMSKKLLISSNRHVYEESYSGFETMKYNCDLLNYIGYGYETLKQTVFIPAQEEFLKPKIENKISITNLIMSNKNSFRHIS
ncbi:MAG: hypothetical protein GQ570_08065 [Helicobacteraceae bacterium]|nr:hypothetical protein [Helicobacteraceae bacterium]